MSGFLALIIVPAIYFGSKAELEREIEEEKEHESEAFRKKFLAPK